MDRHLNLFHHYTHSGTMPIENNVSRGLAIILQEEPGLLFMLLNKLGLESGETIALPVDSYNIGFQVRCSEFPDVSTLVGVSLTARELTNDNSELSENMDDAYNPITDISIMYDDTLIIIEVKRDGTDCRKQLTEQLQKYREFKKNVAGDIDVKETKIDLSWDKVMTLISRYMKMANGKTSRIVSDYYEEVTTQFPSWAPREPLGNLEANETERIMQRIDVIKKIYINKYSLSDGLMYGRGAIPLDFEWASEYNVNLQNDFKDEKGNRKTYLTLGIWPSDTCSQYWTLKRKIKSFDFFKKRYNTVTLNSGEIVKIRVLPYIKFCHFNKGIMWIFNDDFSENHTDELVEWANNGLTGKWKKESWEELQKDMERISAFSPEKKKKFESDFAELFKNTDRSYVTASLGFEVYAYIPYEKARLLDSDFNAPEPELVSYMKEVVDKIKDLIEA